MTTEEIRNAIEQDGVCPIYMSELDAIRAEAIDEFIKRLKDAIKNSAYMCIGVTDMEYIAEQLKEKI